MLLKTAGFLWKDKSFEEIGNKSECLYSLMDLPGQQHLPYTYWRHVLNTPATYKFYWSLSLLEKVETGETRMKKKELFAEMVAQAWYTVNYFKVFFGKQNHYKQQLAGLGIWKV